MLHLHLHDTSHYAVPLRIGGEGPTLYIQTAIVHRAVRSIRGMAAMAEEVGSAGQALGGCAVRGDGKSSSPTAPIWRGAGGGRCSQQQVHGSDAWFQTHGTGTSLGDPTEAGELERSPALRNRRAPTGAPPGGNAKLRLAPLPQDDSDAKRGWQQLGRPWRGASRLRRDEWHALRAEGRFATARFARQPLAAAAGLRWPSWRSNGAPPREMGWEWRREILGEAGTPPSGPKVRWRRPPPRNPRRLHELERPRGRRGHFFFCGEATFSK